MELGMAMEWLLKHIDKEVKAIVSAGSFCLGKLVSLEELSEQQKEADEPANPRPVDNQHIRKLTRR